MTDAAFDPVEILRRLTERGVDFVVIGGIASTLHGAARQTFDLDVTFATDEANLDALGEVLVGIGARLRGVEEDVPFVPDGRALRHVTMLTLATEHGDFDVLRSPEGAPAYDVLRAAADRVDLGEFNVLVATIEHLIAMKRAVGRTKDLVVVEELEAIRDELA